MSNFNGGRSFVASNLSVHSLTDTTTTQITQSAFSFNGAINLNHYPKLYLLKNGDAEPELELLDTEEDVLNESWSESPPVRGFPEVKPTPALPLDDGEDGMFT